MENLINLKISGDSGDGIQIIGDVLAKTIATENYYISTIPDYPSEIRAPSGSIEGVSSFQITFGKNKIISPDNKIDILVALNPASLKINFKYLKKGSVIILNSGSFTQNNLEKVGYLNNPINDGSLSGYEIIVMDANKTIKDLLNEKELTLIQKLKCKNFYLLGFIIGSFDFSSKQAENFISKKFEKKIVGANKEALIEGISLAKNNFIFKQKFKLKKNKLESGKYRILSGNEALVYGLMIGAKLIDKKIYYGSYPITPATDILHTFLKYRSQNVLVFQAEDEIAAIGGAIGASFAGAIGITGTSGPGFSLKSESINLAVMAELPLVIIDVQRGGPSTGLPTKTEQSDLLQALFGRHGESPIVILAAYSPEDCFYTSLEACKIAVKYMTPVIILSDAYIANNKELFKIPEESELQKFEISDLPEIDEFRPYLRNKENLARPWAYPGLPGYEHRIGGLEKDNFSGDISFDEENHELMTKLRHEKIQKIKSIIPKTEINGQKKGDLLIIGWGSTYSSIINGVNKAQKKGLKVSSIHIKYINPLPFDLFEIIKNFKKILVVEENLGQLKFILESNYKIEMIGLNKVKGQPIFPDEIFLKINEIIK